MTTCIGIRGHRGSGKSTISYLLAQALEFYTINKSFEGFEEVYQKAIDRVKLDEDFLVEADFLTHVYFESFADSPKVILSQLIGIPVTSMYNDWCKDSIVVDLKTFHFVQAANKLEKAEMIEKLKPYTASHVWTETNHRPVLFWAQEHIYMTLRELIIYFGKYVMQTYFGGNVWVKSLTCNDLDRETFFGGKKTMYKIFTDVKFPSEISYIKNREGYIVKVSRPDFEKPSTEISKALANDNRFDFEIVIKGELEDLREEIENIVLKIINK